MRKLYALFLFISMAVGAQVGVNTTTPHAMLDIPATNPATPSNTDGILVPRISAFPVINPTAAQHGMMVFLTAISAGNAPGFYYWDNPTASWKGIVGSVTGGWALTGNPGTNPASNFIGTTNAVGLTMRTNNSPRFLIDQIGSGRFGITGFSDSLSDRSRFEINAEDTDFNDLTLRFAGVDHPVFNIIHNRGKFTNPERLLADDVIGEIKFFTHEPGATSFGGHAEAARIGVRVENNSGNISSGMYFRTTAGGLEPIMYLNGQGNVGINTDTPTAKLHVVGQFLLNNGTQANGRILRTNGTGVTSWVEPSSVFSGSLDGAYDFPTAGAGRTIIADFGPVTISGTDGFLITGLLGSGNQIVGGGGTKLFWNPRKAAFRAGSVTNQWDEISVGEHSTAFGFETVASGNYSMSANIQNAATGPCLPHSDFKTPVWERPLRPSGC
ncbi:MAG: hypothetical protein EOO50_00845 [Flavobacterium sp.]|uniref:hypothetical protein n=1 Tax=Flavobacterium sp. TaxID=239 RepID=UPI001212ADD3|nr:hypothetical protein [Flavobacterium sp.]RZJ68759.1 MAG: hypothetical protein EOO50_00845 [Flavobacterium sp.]